MFNKFWRVITSTPWWVWLLFAYLIFVGIKARKGGVMHLWRLFALPVILVVWFLWSAFAEFGFHVGLLGLWILGLALGCALGWFYVRKKEVRSDKKHFLIEVPADKALLPYLIVLFLVKYFFGYKLALGEMIGATVKWSLIVSGFFAGVLAGKCANYYIKYQKSPSQNLKK